MPHLTSKPEFPLALPSKFNLKQPFGRASHLSVGLGATMPDMEWIWQGHSMDIKGTWDSQIKTEVLDTIQHYSKQILIWYKKEHDPLC